MATAIDAQVSRARFDGRFRTAALAVGVVLLELLLGAAIGSSQAKYAALLVLGVVFAALVWRFPLPATFLALFLAAGVIYPQYFVFHVGARTVYGYEAVLAVLLARAAFKPARMTWGGAAGAALALFFAILILSTGLAVQAGSVSSSDAINWARPFFPLTLFWVVVRLFPDRAALGKLLTAGIAIGAISGFVGIVLALAGSVDSVFQDSGNQILTTGTIGSLLRVRMPGLPLAFMLLWLLLLWISRGQPPRWLWWSALPGMLLAIAVSQNRNMWLFGVIALAMLLVLTGRRTRRRIVFALGILAAGVALAVAAPQGSDDAGSPLDPIVQRASTLLNPSALSKSQSALDREREIRLGWAKARDNLLIGIGPGVPYGMTVASDIGGGKHIVSQQLFLHNQYLYLLLITGIPGLLAFVVFVLATLRPAFTRTAMSEVRALAIGVVALMLTGAVMLSLSDPSYLIALGLVAGAIAALCAPRKPAEAASS